MKKIISITVFMLGIGLLSYAQTYTASPLPFTAEDEVTITVDVTGTSLAGYTGDVWIWTWVSKGCSSNCDAPTNIDPAGGADTEAAKMTRVDDDVYSITFIPTVFFEKSPSELQQIGFKLKSESWGDGKQSDNDVNIDIEPLIFVPKINRNFPSKVSQDDVITLYLDQNYAEDFDLKYQTGNFSLEVQAFDADGVKLGETVLVDAGNEGEGIHSGSILPTFSFETGGTQVDKIAYKFISVDNSAVESPSFEIILIK